MAEKKENASTGMMKAAGILVMANLLSSILGYIRNIIISSTFGLGVETDAYYGAFTIPDLIYTVLVGGGLSSAFIPVFSAYISDKDYKNGYRMASTVLNVVAVVAAVLCVAGEIFAPEFLPLIMDFSKGGDAFYHLTIRLTRIMFFQCFFMCLTGICMGILQSYKKFTPPSVGAVCYNITIILVGVLLLTAGFGITGFSIGVVAGSVVNFLIQVFPIRRLGFRYERVIDLHHPGVKKFFRLFWPVLLGISVQQLNLVVNKYFGSGVGKSVLSSMANAQSIMQLPINIFAMSISMSIFPDMVDDYSHGRLNRYKEELTMGIRNVVFITLPCAVGLIAVRVPLIRALYYQGNFSEKNVEDLATLLMFYCIGIVGYSVRQVLSQGFYSIQETRTPVRINIFILILNMTLSAVFVRIWNANGIALAYSIAGLTSMTLLWFFLRRKVGGLKGREVLVSVLKIITAAAVMAAVILLCGALFEKYFSTERKMMQFTELILLVVLGAAVYIGMAALLRMRELKAVLDVMRRRVRR